MPRQRHISPAFFTHPDLQAAEIAAQLPLRLAYAGLWCHADREGRFEWKPRVLQLGILPFDDVDFEGILNALVAAQFVVKYEVSGRVYGVIPTFLRHQHPHPKEAPSKCPSPSDPMASTLPASGKQVASKLLATEEPVGVSSLRSIKPSSLQASAQPSKRLRTPPPEWAVATAAALSGVGVVTPEGVYRALNSWSGLNATVVQHGPMILVKAAQSYVRAMGREDAKQARFYTVKRFLQEPGIWVEQVRPGGGLELLGDNTRPA